MDIFNLITVILILNAASSHMKELDKGGADNHFIEMNKSIQNTMR